MRTTSPGFSNKLCRVFLSCKTPEQLQAAERYRQLAIRQGYVRGFEASIDERAIIHVQRT